MIVFYFYGNKFCLLLTYIFLKSSWRPIFDPGFENGMEKPVNNVCPLINYK